MVSSTHTRTTIEIRHGNEGPLKKKPLRVASLFAGCGGLDLGFVGGFEFRKFVFPRNNFKLVFSNDFDKDAQRVYDLNSERFFSGKMMKFGDIRNFPAAEIPEFDILLAGFPCQPFSNAGLRGSTLDEKGRGTLFYECERILKYAIKNQDSPPRAFVFENVRGILSSKMPDGTPVVDEITKRMKRLGYHVSTQLVNTSEFGVAQNRYRVLMVGVRKEYKSFDFHLMHEVVMKSKLPTSSGEPYELLMGSILSDIPKTAPQYDAYWKFSPSGQEMVDMIGPCTGNRNILTKFRNGVSLEKMDQSISVGRSWKNIPPSKLKPRFRKIYDNPKKYHAPNFYRRFALAEICGTVTASAQPENCGITHPFENRRLTIREAARVQSFPDTFDFETQTLQGSYKVIGNAVPPILGWVIARALEKSLK
jgi:DNA (cytosine-5)-methyltransferase 1